MVDKKPRIYITRKIMDGGVILLRNQGYDVEIY